MKIPNLYEVQKSFISDCKRTIENAEVGIFSSPTGTGKTLSLLLSVIDYITESEEDDLLLEHILGPSTRTKIYFCSRTHSQLKQCILEFKNLELKTNSVILGSRKIYCINKEVDNKENIDKVNLKCRDLIKNDQCDYYNKEMLISGIFDIEEMVKEGRRQKVCPYYFTKKYFKKCEIVFLPYTVLFNDESRNSLNINLSNSIVIVDEAHNIIEAVNGINTKIVYFDNLERYLIAFEKYSRILQGKSKNRENVIKLKEIFEKLLKFKGFFGKPGDVNNNMIKTGDMNNNLVKPGDVNNNIVKTGDVNINMIKTLDVNSVLFESGLLHFNMLDIEEILKTSNFFVKIESYGKLNNKIYEIMKFLTLLVNSDTNCKIELTSKFIKIFPVDSKLYFEPFLDCQSVIFAGGTMEPIKPLKDIFSSRIVHHFSYDSVATDFKGFLISKINFQKFELNEKTRDMEIIQLRMKNTIEKLIDNTKSGGIVIFVPSKYYLEILRKLFVNTGNLFFENYDLFDDYKSAVENGTSVLFAVMGGKLSEGMNFNDQLCRILVIFGIPFPNMTNEISEKIKYFGNDFYLQIAMKKVNQTIGRAIRHVKDYAAIYLIDSRYLRYRNEISPWFSKKLENVDLEDAIRQTKDFLDTKINST